MPDGSGGSDPASVVLLTAEDGLADTVRKRLDAAGADCSRVHVLESVPQTNRDGVVVGQRPPTLPDDIEHLAALVRDKGAALVIIDVLTAYLSGNVKAYNDQDVRRALMPLAKMAEGTRAAVIVLRHPRKGGGTALEAGGGSIGIVGAARSVLVAAVDPDDDDRRVLAVAACNIAAPVTALAFTLEADPEHDSSRVVWLGPTAHRADDLTQPRDDEDRTARGEAEEFLRDVLGGDGLPANDVKRAAADAGISYATLRRAKRRLGVDSRKVGQPGKEGQTWCWVLPEGVHSDGPSGEGAQFSEVSTFDGGERLRDAPDADDVIAPQFVAQLQAVDFARTEPGSCVLCGKPARVVAYWGGDHCGACAEQVAAEHDRDDTWPTAGRMDM